MRILLDEGLPFRLAVWLTKEGHDVAAIGRDHPHALTDREVLAIAYRERRLLLTNDKDFGDLVFRDQHPHAGIVLFRLGYVPIDVRIARLQRVFEEHATWLDHFIVVSQTGIKVRPAPKQEDELP